MDSCARNDCYYNKQGRGVLAKLPHYSAKERISVVAKKVDDTRKLIEAGFEYVTEIDDVRIFRKRK